MVQPTMERLRGMSPPSPRIRRLAPALAAALGAPVLALALIVLATHATRAGGISQMLKGAEAAHPSALWHVVHDLCVTDMTASGHAAPCVKVDLAGGYALLHDPEPGHSTQFLLTPTRRVAGIESAQLQASGSPNYWQAAWSARGLLERQVGRSLPREAVGLAVNSAASRTQDQLHIHIDCVRPDVAAALKAEAPRIGLHWRALRNPSFPGFRARWAPGPELGADPFKLLAHADPTARADMQNESLFVMGATRAGRPGFILVSRHDVPPADVISAEDLLDHSCRVAGQLKQSS
jgi:CDP-diacylglycerol pyrophosphatase